MRWALPRPDRCAREQVHDLDADVVGDAPASAADPDGHPAVIGNPNDATNTFRSVGAEAREILADAWEREPVTLVDLLGTSEGVDIDFEPRRLGLTARTPDL